MELSPAVNTGFVAKPFNSSATARQARTPGEQSSTPLDPVSGEPTASAKAATAEAADRDLQQVQQVQKLAKRDREVRAHEQAHAAAGGQYAGSIVLDYTRGPNGVNYASSGHVSIDSSEVPGDPDATLKKAIIVQRAALAPADPSPQDRQVAARAAQMAAQARADIARLRADKAGFKQPGSESPSADFDTPNDSE